MVAEFTVHQVGLKNTVEKKVFGTVAPGYDYTILLFDSRPFNVCLLLFPTAAIQRQIFNDL
jgi:hypothetical protein